MSSAEHRSADGELPDRRRWIPGGIGIALLAALAYLPALASSRGTMTADTKLYLYLDPGRLITDALYTFDARQFAGWVPHQVIAYLWPQGPWYWLGEQAGLADWIVHRLWIGTLMFVAGCGVLWCARRLGFGIAAAVAAALVYQVSPYVLPYVSRTSAMLLPWAGLGWIVGLTVLAARRGGWRFPALLALVVATVGAVNATALAMVVPAPALWLIVSVTTGEVSWRRAAATAGRVGVLCLGTSAWWIGAVAVQGRHGADVLSFSESLRSVSGTSTAGEVWRGMGYWLDYVNNHVAPTTTAALQHMFTRKVIAASFAVAVAGVIGLTTTRFVARRYAVTLVVTGVVLGVGVHPIDDPSPLMNLLVGDSETGAALALRSSTRAVPVLLLGLACGVAALVDAVGSGARAHAGGRRRSPGVAIAGVLAVAVVLVVVVVGMPALRNREYIDPALARAQDVPAAWSDAAATLDAGPAGYRVLQLPGQEFGAYRWGVTVDPPLPGLTNRPLVTRDLLPLGTPAAMDLLWALDNRFQDGVAEPAAVAPIARLLGADQIWLTGDVAYERYRTPRPELTSAFFANAIDGLGTPVPYGPPMANIPAVPTVDEVAVTDGRIGQPVAPVELVPVEDAVPVVRARDRVVLVAGSGDGLVDAAAAGLLDGRQLIRYTGSLAALDEEARAVAVAGASELIVTDSYRDRSASWGSSQDTLGFTESAEIEGRDVLDASGNDVRLEVFGPDGVATMTDAVHDGPVSARATGYGDAFSLRPEDRAVMAIDDDPTTAWRVADRFEAVGQRIQLRTDAGVDHVTLLQPSGADAVRNVASVRIQVDGDAGQVVELDERSFSGDGQRIELPATSAATTVAITIDDVNVPDRRLGPALAAVGFAEIDLGLGPTTEVVRVADDLAAEPGAAGLDTTYVFSRLRTDPLDRWRTDPEPELVREWQQAADVPAVDPTITVRLDRRASDEVLAELLGIDGPHSAEHATGAVAAAGWSAADGDPATAWVTPFAGAVGAELTFEATAPARQLRFVQAAGAFSPITSVRVTGPATGDAEAIDVDVPVVVDADNVSVVDLPGELAAGSVTMTITGVDAQTTLDRRYGEPVELPGAIAEIETAAATDVPTRMTTGCRDDLVQLDGEPLSISVEGDVAALLAGDPVTATRCDDGALGLDAGSHRLTTSAGGTGLRVDRVVLAPTQRPARSPTGAVTATVTDQDRLSRTITVAGCDAGCWLVLGEGYHSEWSAATEGGSLGPPQLVDGGFNGWWIEPTGDDVVVTTTWNAQRPVDLALWVTLGALFACVVLAVVGWRRDRAPANALVAIAAPDEGGRWAFPGTHLSWRRRAVVVGVWAAASVVLVAPGYGVLALVAGGVLVGAMGRARLVGLLTVAILVLIAQQYNWIVLHDQPYPDYGFPTIFENLHRLALFAAVSLVALVVADNDDPEAP